MKADIKKLSDTLINEIVAAVGLPTTEGFHRFFGMLFHDVTDRLAKIGSTFDQLVKEAGFPKAAEWALTNWCSRVTGRGIENIPTQGPLLVVSNHPGTYDSLVIASLLRRKDMRFIASAIPFLQNLPHAKDHLFFIHRTDTHNRMLGARQAIRHMQEGGALLMFGSGNIDPDPAVYDHAAEHLDAWYSSIELFLRLVPQARILLTIVSNVVSPKWAYHPITWLRKHGLDKRRLAEFGQVITQLLSPGRLMLTPYVSFATPASVRELQNECGSEHLLPSIINRARALLTDHLAWTSSLIEA